MFNIFDHKAKQISKILDRLIELRGIMDRDGEATDDAIFQEYRKLSVPVVECFAHPLGYLAAAGLLGIYLGDNAQDLSEAIEFELFDVSSVYCQDGKIWIGAGEWENEEENEEENVLDLNRRL